MDELRKKIERDLKKQMKEKAVKGKHYEDLLQDYLALWDLKGELISSIREDGIQIMGMHGPKSNPSIADLHKTNDRMIKILEALGLKANPIEPEKGTPKRSAADLL